MITLALLGCQPDGSEVFERDVVPVLEERCASAACHGVGPGAEAAGEQIDRSLLFVDVDYDGRLTDVSAAYATTKRAITTVEDPSLSSLLRKPLAAAFGGVPHYGGESFPSPDDPAYRALAEWIAHEAGGGEDATPLNALEQQFADDVQPFLVGATCMSGACHGAATGVPLKFDPGVGGVIGRAATRVNYEAARTMTSLDGVPATSRIVRKSLPLGDGGIVHKGGNRSFLTGLDDARLAAILGWICAEREAATGAPCVEDAGVAALVFVRGPVAPEDPFELEAFVPGTDLWLATLAPDLTVTSERNLTAALHTGPADVRDPAVDATGKLVVFAMRGSGDSGHALWELELGTGAARQLTVPPRGSDRDPTYGPDGEVWFTSSRANEAGDAGRIDAELWSVETTALWTTRRTHTPHVERKPVFLFGGQEASGTVNFTALREVFPAQRRGHPFRFPPGLGSEYHQQFGVTATEDLLTDLRELADGRYVTLVSDLANRWGGRPGVLDRNFGPELHTGPPGVPLYAPPLVRLDPDAVAGGVTRRVWRDPVGLPDGNFLAASAEGPVDLASGEAPDFGITLAVLREAPDGTGPTIAERRTLLDTLGVAEFDPEPVFARSPPPPTPQKWDPAQSTAVLKHQGFPMIDALLGALPPTGPKTPRDDFVAVRVIEAVRVSPEAWGRVTLGTANPGRVLAEVPLEADGTFLAEVPANTSVRLQGIDSRGVAVGTPHNRWFDVHPGQVVPQGVSADVYGTVCAVCHGAQDGRPEDLVPDVDVLTTASLTLARYDDQDPRRPLPPVSCRAEDALPSSFAEVRPVLDRACVACHPDAASGLDLSPTPIGSFDAAYVALWTGGHLGPTALQSPLGARLLDGHGDLDAAERRLLLRWIDVGAAWEIP